MTFRYNRRNCCEVCNLSHTIQKNLAAGFNYICQPCLLQEERERHDQLRLARKALGANAGVKIYAMNDEKSPLPPPVDFEKAMAAWRANKKKVKGGDGSFAYLPGKHVH